MTRYYLGIDGGQSSTTALIADDSGRVVGTGVGGPCNHVSGSDAEAKFTRVMQDCISAACVTAGAPRTIEFAAVCLGLSGGYADKEHLARRVINAHQYKLTHDAETALTGATAGEPGVIVIAGTGSIAFGRGADARTARAGGWGYIYGDEGGAFDLVRRAVRATLQHEEGWGPHTLLADRIHAALGTKTANESLHLLYTADYPRSRVAALAPMLDEAAHAGDLVAHTILDEAASQLALYARAVHGQLFEPHQTAAISYAGGVFRSTIMRAAFSEWILQLIGGTVSDPRFGPAEGALIEALRLGGLDVSPSYG